MTFDISKWRKKAIALYGKSRGLTKPQRDKVTAEVHGKGSNPSRKPAKKTSSRRKKTMPKKKGKKRGGGKLLGNVGLKGMLIGTLGMTGLRWLINRYLGGLGGYNDAVAMIGMGAVGKVVKPAGTAHLFTAGIELGASKLLESIGTGGRFGVTTQRGYDI